MPVAFYMDVHIPAAITEQLRRRGVEVITAIEDRANELPDHQLLQKATAAGRVIFSHDIRFRALAEEWQRKGKPFAGFAYGHVEGASIGQYVKDLELIAKASEPEEWLNTIVFLPL